MFEKLKDKLFNLVHKDKVQKINRMQRQLEKLEDKRLDLEYDLVHERNELYDVDKKYEVNRKYIIEGAKKEFNGIDDYKKQQIIDKLTYLDLGEVTYLEVIKSISGISQIDLYNYSLDDSQDYSQSNMDRLYNMDNSKIINLYKGLESISNETWNEINANFFAEMVYKEGYGVEWMMSQVEQEEEKRVENAKGFLDRKSMESYLEHNNIPTELRNNYDFINLVNANFGLENMLFDSKEDYKSNFYDCWSPDEISDFQDWSKEEQKELRLNFENDKVKTYENMKTYGTLLNFVNKEINKIVGRDIEKVDDGFNELKTNKGLQFEDGSIIRKGTKFIIKEFAGDIKGDWGYRISFEQGDNNIYNERNGINEDYYLTQRKLIEFAEVVESKTDSLVDKEIDKKRESELPLNEVKSVGNKKEYQSSNNLFTNIFENKNKELSFELE